MTPRGALIARQAELLARCAEQRDELTFVTGAVGRSFWFVGAALVASRRAAAHPVVLAGVVVVALAIGPIRITRWLAWGVPVIVAARRAAALWSGRALGVDHR